MGKGRQGNSQVSKTASDITDLKQTNIKQSETIDKTDENLNDMEALQRLADLKLSGHVFEGPQTPA